MGFKRYQTNKQKETHQNDMKTTIKWRTLPVLGLLGAALAFNGSNVHAATVLPGDPAWASIGNSGLGSSAVTPTVPRSGNGSLELTGDRTRFTGLGNPFDPLSNLGLLSSVTDFRFDWSVAIGSSQGTTLDYSPALRLHIWDGLQRSELIWENAYNGPTPVVQGTWYSSGSADNFWRFETGPGDSGIYNRTIAEWSTDGYSANAYVAAISVGVGSSAAATYHAFADNVVLDFGAGPTTYNFEAFADQDGDGIGDNVDNCPTTANTGQADTDNDGVGDVCDNCPTTTNADQADTDSDGVGDACDACPNDADNDADSDGLCGDVDACPTSNLDPTVIIDGCDSGVLNTRFPNGCTISDLIAECAAGAINHDQFVNCVGELLNSLKAEGVITGKQKGAIQSCASQSSIGK